MNKTKLLAAGAAAATICAVPAFADHSWGSYHWERTSPEITVPVVDFTTGEWRTSNRVAIAVADWNESAFIQSPVSRGTYVNTACPIVGGEIHVCNDEYGKIGWVGIASIATTRGRNPHIAGGVSKMNDSYYNDPNLGYDNPVWRQLVMCQEIGHDYGLGHQNENFSTNTTDSCMEYTNTPTQIDMTPDQHDYDQLVSIYAHSHSSDGGGNGGPGGGKGKPKKFDTGVRPSDWGTPVGRDAQGRANLYKRSTASYDIYTHVTWAIGEGPDGHHDGDHNGDHHH